MSAHPRAPQPTSPEASTGSCFVCKSTFHTQAHSYLPCWLLYTHTIVGWVCLWEAFARSPWSASMGGLASAGRKSRANCRHAGGKSIANCRLCLFAGVGWPGTTSTQWLVEGPGQPYPRCSCSGSLAGDGSSMVILLMLAAFPCGWSGCFGATSPLLLAL